MDFSLINTSEGMDALGTEWNALLAESACNVPFLRHEYLTAWWQGRGGDEFPQAELRVVTAWQSGVLVGIAPLFSAPNAAGESALFLLGGIEISDYLDLIVRPQHLSGFLNGLLTFLEEQVSGWQALDWYNLPDSSPSLPLLEAECKRRGWGFTSAEFRPTVAVPLTGDFETYLAGIDKKQRHEIRRKMRRAAEHNLPVSWRVTADASQLEKDLEAFLGLMAQEPEKADFLTPAMRTQMKAIARTAFQAGWLQLAFLEVDGQGTAAYLNFDYDNRIWVYNSGLDRRHLELSPGWVLLGHLLQWANEHRRTEFDFMRGDEGYKSKFGGIRRSVWQARVERKD